MATKSTATVRSISPAAAAASAAAVAVAAGKLPCPIAVQAFPEAVWAEFQPQIDDPKLSQRPHDEQVNSGMWEHLETPCSTQATLEVVEIIKLSASGRRLKAERRLVDGYHRLYFWFMVSKMGCPFYKLNLMTHRLEVPVGTHDDEIDEMVDELARTINSKQSVKDNADFLTAAVREAFGKSERMQSKAYRLGIRAVSYLKRTIGEPAKLSGPKLKASVLMHRDAHLSMDKLFYFVENNANVRQYSVQVFHTGTAKAIFDSMSSIATLTGKLFAVDVLKQALEHTTTSMGGCASLVPSKPLISDLVRVFRELADPKIDAEMRAKGGNREGFYTEVAKRMKPSLDALVKAAKRK